MIINGQQKRKLQEAILNAFPNKLSLEQMLLFELEKNLDVCAGGNNLEEIVFNLIKRADSQGWIEDLVQASLNANPGNLKLKAIAEELLTKVKDERETPNSPSLIETMALPPISIFAYEVVTYDINGQEISRNTKQAQYFTQSFSNNAHLEMVYISGDKYMMGSKEEGYSHKLPQHEITIKPFFISKFQVTQELWKAIVDLPKINRDLDPEPSRFKGNKHPVERVSWHDAVEFCDRLSRQTGLNYRLPSEAEWEYACCGGTNTSLNFAKSKISQLANCKDKAISNFNSPEDYQQGTTPVGTFLPNAFGLYDMQGNVWEWCADHWHSNYQKIPIDGSAWISNIETQYRTIRGGSWHDLCSSCSCTNRDYREMDSRSNAIGFRIVLQKST